MKQNYTLHVYYTVFGPYRMPREAAEQLARKRNGLSVETWDVFELSHDQLLKSQVRAFPTVRLFAGHRQVAESTAVFWTEASLARWVDTFLFPYAWPGTRSLQAPARKSAFICPECLSGDAAKSWFVDGPHVESDPWSGILSITQCRRCRSIIPNHLGERWRDLSLEQVQKEWREIYRDSQPNWDDEQPASQGERIPVLESDDPVVVFLLKAVRSHRTVDFAYWGGREPGRSRTVTPAMLFRLETRPAVYLAGHCHLRNAKRVFNIEKIKLAAGPVRL